MIHWHSQLCTSVTSIGKTGTYSCALSIAIISCKCGVGAMGVVSCLLRWLLLASLLAVVASHGPSLGNHGVALTATAGLGLVSRACSAERCWQLPAWARPAAARASPPFGSASTVAASCHRGRAAPAVASNFSMARPMKAAVVAKVAPPNRPGGRRPEKVEEMTRKEVRERSPSLLLGAA